MTGYGGQNDGIQEMDTVPQVDAESDHCSEHSGSSQYVS